ncbi:MAG: hemerythrin domain-containing protein [Burkholderiales bacterium]
MDVVEKVRTTLGTYSDTDVRALLKADHETVQELAEALAEAKSGPQRRSLLAQLKPLITAHARAEEQAVYVPLTQVKDSPDSRLMGSEGAVEHFLVDTLLEKLDAARDATSDMWRAHATVLQELLEHHIKEEESEMFEELGEHFTADEREAMAVQFATLRDERLASETSPRRSASRGNGARRDVGRVRRAQAA